MSVAQSETRPSLRASIYCLAREPTRAIVSVRLSSCRARVVTPLAVMATGAAASQRRTIAMVWRDRRREPARPPIMIVTLFDTLSQDIDVRGQAPCRCSKPSPASSYSARRRVQPWGRSAVRAGHVSAHRRAASAARAGLHDPRRPRPPARQRRLGQDRPRPSLGCSLPVVVGDTVGQVSRATVDAPRRNRRNPHRLAKVEFVLADVVSLVFERLEEQWWADWRTRSRFYSSNTASRHG